MGNISIELVPRNTEALTREFQLVRQAFPSITTVNIPDLLKFPLRSWEGCCQARSFFTTAIPHIRAIDFDLNSNLPLGRILAENGLDTVLVVAGDWSPDLSPQTFRTTSLQLIATVKAQMPDVRVFAGIDPYRSGIRAEIDYAAQKMAAGADGFFTQPFFDLRLMAVYHDLLKGIEVYWGVSPVVSRGSRNYWEQRNRAIFPSDFEATLAWNRRFAAQALEFGARTGSNLYFMPIRVGLVEYLGGILN